MTVKLFDTHKETEAEQTHSDNTQIVEAQTAPLAEAEKLVLQIEGVGREVEPDDMPALKAETKELPNREEIRQIELRTKLRVCEEGDDAASEEEAQSAAEAPKEEAEPAAEAMAEDAAPAAEAKAEERVESTEPDVKEWKPAEKQNLSVTYASVAEAVESAKKEPTGRFNRDAVDDETLLAELYALIGDGGKTKPAARSEAAEKKASPKIAPRPAARLNPEALDLLPEDPEDLQEEDGVGVPGWLKGIFILLISLLLSAMTIYAVASDVLGELF